MPCVRMFNRPGTSRAFAGVLRMYRYLLPFLVPLFSCAVSLAAAAPPPLLVSDDWSARAALGNFLEVGKSGNNQFVLMLPKGASQFVIILVSPSFVKLGSGPVKVQISFQGGDVFNFEGAHYKGMVNFAVSDAALPSLTLDMMHLSAMTASFPDGEMPAWSFDLSGARPTMKVLAGLVRQSESANLPPPWGNRELTCSVADSETLNSNIYLIQPSGAQVVQFSQFEMAQTSIGWACLVRVDFLGGSFQYLAYRLPIKPDGQIAMQTQIMGQADLSQLYSGYDPNNNATSVDRGP